jgi:hypothetical protein
VVRQERPGSVEELAVEPVPRLAGEETDALPFLEHVGVPLAVVGDEAEGDVAGDPERQAREGGDLPPSERAAVAVAVLALDRPELAVPGLRDQVDALVGGGKVEVPAHLRRHLLEQPHVRELGRVHRVDGEVELGEELEGGPLLLGAEGAEAVLEVRPAIRLGDG